MNFLCEFELYHYAVSVYIYEVYLALATARILPLINQVDMTNQPIFDIMISILYLVSFKLEMCTIMGPYRELKFSA